MPSESVFLEYQGAVDNPLIEKLLKKLKETAEFNALDTITRKRTYSIFVESIENICKYAVKVNETDQAAQPYVKIIQKPDCLIFRAGNAVTSEMKEKITVRIDMVNNLNLHELKKMHETRISSDPVQGENGAGLGFICMAFRSGNKIGYSFLPADNDLFLFEIQICINKYFMRKLIIEQTSSSPMVVLDPEKKVYEITGESRPPDVREFYGQIISWMDDFSILLLKRDNKADPVHFSFNFGYFNSSSGKLILDICKILARLHSKGMNIKINWCYEKDDVDMLEAGQEMSRIVKLPFEYTETEPKQFLS